MEQLIVTPAQADRADHRQDDPLYDHLHRPDGPRHALRRSTGSSSRWPGAIPALFLATCLFLLSTLGIGLFISTVSKTQQQAMMTTFFFILPFFMLSGFVFPDREHARRRSVVDIPQPFALFSRHHPRDLSQGGGAAHPLAPVRGPGRPRRRGLCRGGGAFPETAGLGGCRNNPATGVQRCPMQWRSAIRLKLFEDDDGKARCDGKLRVFHCR